MKMNELNICVLLGVNHVPWPRICVVDLRLHLSSHNTGPGSIVNDWS